MEIQKMGNKHDTCPRCGSTDTFWGDSDPDPDNNSVLSYDL